MTTEYRTGGRWSPAEPHTVTIAARPGGGGGPKTPSGRPLHAEVVINRWPRSVWFAAGFAVGCWVCVGVVLAVAYFVR